MIEILNRNIPYGAIPIEKALSGMDFYKYSKERGYKIIQCPFLLPRAT